MDGRRKRKKKEEEKNEEKNMGVGWGGVKEAYRHAVEHRANLLPREQSDSDMDEEGKQRD